MSNIRYNLYAGLQKKKHLITKRFLPAFIATLALVGFGKIMPAFGVASSGAIFTTDSVCAGTNINIYSNKDAVYVDGGPAHPGAAGLTDGSYFVKVTVPDGTVLGQGNGAPITVTAGAFISCYQLSAIVKSASSGFTTFGYDDTTNPGGEYKVWVCSTSDFTPGTCKTDNFKVKPSNQEQPPQAQLHIRKFYDANANGINDDGQLITGWKFRVHDGIDFIRFTPVDLVIDPDTYEVNEFDAVETNWIHTTPATVSNIVLNDGDNHTEEFGNVCLGAGGGHTLGFWSNKNGQITMNDGGSDAPELALLSSLNLVNANGSAFNPGNYSQFRNWLLNANSTNMAYMLSAQLSAMELNVEAGTVSGGALVYAPGVPGANFLGFISINDLMSAANTQLGVHPLTTSASDPVNRAIQEAIKNALDKANNNINFVQPTPCAFSFAS